MFAVFVPSLSSTCAWASGSALFLRVIEAKTSGSGLSSSDEIDKSEMPDAKEWSGLDCENCGLACNQDEPK